MRREVMQVRVFGLYCEAKDVLSELSTKSNMIMTAVLMLWLCNVIPVFAAGGLFDELATQLQNAYNSFIPIVNIVALIFSGVTGIFYMTASDDKSASAAKRWGIRILVGWLIVSVFPFILIKAREMLGSSATGTSIDELKNIKPGS